MSRELQFRRGTEAQAESAHLLEGEPGYITDKKKLYIGPSVFLNEADTLKQIGDFKTGYISKLNPIASDSGAYTNKTKLNHNAANINFVKNKVISDGLLLLNEYNKKIDVSAKSKIHAISQMIVKKGDTVCGLHGFSPGGEGLCTTETADETFNLKMNSIETISNQVAKTNTPVIIETIYDLKTGKHDCWVYDENYNCIFNYNGIFSTALSFDTFIFTKNTVSDIFIYINSFAYGRELTQAEIKHNLAVLNDSEAIQTIEATDLKNNKTSHILATDSNHVALSNGFNIEEAYTSLLKTMCPQKPFATSNSNIVIDNGVKNSKVLSAKFTGNTVKCVYADSSWITRETMQGYAESSVTIDKIPQLKPNSTYVLVCEIKENTRPDRFKPSTSTTTKTFNETFYVDAGATGIYKFVATTKNDFNGIANAFTSMSESNTVGGKITFRRCLLEIKDVSLVKSFMPFGLNASQLVVTNNGISYPFYASLEDKSNSKVIELNKVDNISDTFKILEDGSGKLTQNLYKYIIAGNEEINAISQTFNGTFLYDIKIPKLPKSSSPVICDKLDNCKSELLWNNDFIATSISVERMFRVRLTANSKEKALAYLKGITIVCQLETPIVTIVPKELMPVINVQLSNTITNDSAIKMSAMEINAPVNRYQEQLKEIETLSHQLTALSTLTTE